MRSRLLFCGMLVLVAAVCVRLGVWQVHRLRERRSANLRAAAAFAAPIVDLDTLAMTAGGLAHRRVRITGRYDRAHEVVLRGMTLNEMPGVHVVTPLVRRDGGLAALVKRGFAPAPDAVSADLASLDETGDLTVTGIALLIGSGADTGSPLSRAGRVTWARLDLAALQARSPYPLLSIYILQLPDSGLPAAPRRLALPPLDDGPHLSYAIQWFAFATIALVMAGIFAVRSPVLPWDHRAAR